MLSQSSFEFDRPLTGMEIECNLVDADYQPSLAQAATSEKNAVHDMWNWLRDNF